MPSLSSVADFQPSAESWYAAVHSCCFGGLLRGLCSLSCRFRGTNKISGSTSCGFLGCPGCGGLLDLACEVSVPTHLIAAVSAHRSGLLRSFIRRILQDSALSCSHWQCCWSATFWSALVISVQEPTWLDDLTKLFDGLYLFRSCSRTNPRFHLLPKRQASVGKDWHRSGQSLSFQVGSSSIGTTLGCPLSASLSALSLSLLTL